MRLATTDRSERPAGDDPLALLAGMLLDQQIPMEKAFTSPHVLAERMGAARLDAHAIAEYDPDAFEALFRQVPALHRFPAAMAKRVQELCRALVEQYDGDTATVWTTAADGPDLVKRIAGLPGFGDQKARIFTALLGKQFGVSPPAGAKPPETMAKASFRSVADVVDKDSLGKVRAFKKEQKAAAKATQ